MRRLHFILFSPNKHRAGGEGLRWQTFSILFSPLCSAHHERDWPPCKVIFFGLGANTLNVRNNNNNNNYTLHQHNRYKCNTGVRQNPSRSHLLLGSQNLGPSSCLRTERAYDAVDVRGTKFAA